MRSDGSRQLGLSPVTHFVKCCSVLFHSPLLERRYLIVTSLADSVKNPMGKINYVWA